MSNAPLALQAATEISRPAGCVRPDRANIVVFTGVDRHIHQLRLSAGRWVHEDISERTNAPGASASPAVLARPDQIVSIVYISGSHIHAIEMRGETGSHIDLTQTTGAPGAYAFGAPTQLIRGDGVVSVVYTRDGGVRDKIHELALRDGRWVHANLSELTQTPVSNPVVKTSGYVRPGRVASVIYAEAAGIKELALPAGGRWESNDLFASLHAPKPEMLRWPTAFVRSDGAPSVLYADAQGFVHELALVGDRWSATAVSQAANAPRIGRLQMDGPAGYIRGDGITAIIYYGRDGHVHELALIDGRWRHTDLSLAANTSTGGYPFGYVRSDGASCVLYRTSDGHIHELSLARG